MTYKEMSENEEYEQSDFADQAGKYSDPKEYAKLKASKKGKELKEAVLEERRKANMGEGEYKKQKQEIEEADKKYYKNTFGSRHKEHR